MGLKKKIRKEYEKNGQLSAIALADKLGADFGYCKGCETSSPTKNSTCLICGQPTRPEIVGFKIPR